MAYSRAYYIFYAATHISRKNRLYCGHNLLCALIRLSGLKPAQKRGFPGSGGNAPFHPEYIDNPQIPSPSPGKQSRRSAFSRVSRFVQISQIFPNRLKSGKAPCGVIIILHSMLGNGKITSEYLWFFFNHFDRSVIL